MTVSQIYSDFYQLLMCTIWIAFMGINSSVIHVAYLHYIILLIGINF